MTLKNRDGSELKLSRPNPIMATQEAWKKEEKLIFHNKIGKIVVINDPTAPTPVTSRPMKPAVRPIDRVMEFEFDESTLAQAREIIDKKDPLIVETLEEPEVGEGDENKVQVWCLPASFKEYKDALYGEQYRKVRYGNKFLCEAIILDLEDLYMTLWSNTKAITTGSILFPRTHDKRWWRVEGIKEQDGGYVIYSTISDYQPKFVD